ncbi:hypothetical protein JN00_0208 [Metamycoplasma subdolum]|uniref:Lipoprotein n=1 Tax=Metamycoplasma subdolum TaxID=92407 RepID=A0A3M0A1P0_9BACT|nr:hypothetical protein [Metamycoplasma subdolum]RMA78567.1 hypothetical protein JN00_0208 [Metamycoplasma subdolum]WPB50294.1 hypothetical protein R9C05_01625 [Metamycoplasma subdolum]
MKKNIWLLNISSLALISPVLISSACTDRKERSRIKRLIKETIENKIFEYKIEPEPDSQILINDKKYEIKDYFYGFAIGSYENIQKQYSNDYFVIDVMPIRSFHDNTERFPEDDGSKPLLTEKQGNIVSLILNKEFGTIIGLYDDPNVYSENDKYYDLETYWGYRGKGFGEIFEDFCYDEENKQLIFKLHYCHVDNSITKRPKTEIAISEAKINLDFSSKESGLIKCSWFIKNLAPDMERKNNIVLNSKLILSKIIYPEK